jgi:hypothetical protein
MGTFVEFYRSFLKFVNFKLYNSLNLVYPPKINLKLDAAGVQLSALKLKSLNDNAGPSKADIENLLDTQKVNFSHIVFHTYHLKDVQKSCLRVSSAFFFVKICDRFFHLVVRR